MGIHADLGTAAHTVLETCLKSIYEWDLPAKALDYVDQEVEVVDEPHSRLSPSGAKRWMSCPASVRIAEEYPEPAQGPRKVVFDRDYAWAVQMTLDYVAEQVQKWEMAGQGPVTVTAERRVSPSRTLLTDDHDGTVDITLRTPNFVEVIDFKSGAGVPVMADDPQLDLYLLGDLCETAPEDPSQEHPVTGGAVTVVQPRCDKVHPPIRSRAITDISRWLTEFVDRVLDARNRIKHEPDAFGPSEGACRFCPVGGLGGYDGRPVCKAYEEHALRQAGVLVDGTPLPETVEGMYTAAVEMASADTRFLTPAQLRGLLDARELLQGALQAVEAWAQDHLEKGTAPPEIAEAYKVVPGRSYLQWAEKDNDLLEKMLKKISVSDPKTGKNRKLGKKDLLVTRLKSAPKVRDMLKDFGIPKGDARWDAFYRLAKKPEGKPTIAPLSDPRDAKPVKASAEEMFDPSTVPEAPPIPAS